MPRSLHVDLAALPLLLSFTACGSSDDAPAPVVVSVPALPALESASPSDGLAEVPRTAWLVLRFVEDVDPAALAGLDLSCSAEAPAFDADVVGGSIVVVNPQAELPPDATCTLAWRGPDGDETLHFDVATTGAPAVLAYDRSDTSATVPFPDDFWLGDDAATPTGKRVAFPTPDRPADVQQIFGILAEQSKKLDGFSPLGAWVVELPDAPDAGSLPLDEVASLDPFATVGLFDIDDASSTFGARVPFDCLVQNQTSADGSAAHHLVIFSSVPLEARGRYALVVTRRALIDATRPLEPTSFFAGVSDPEGSRKTEVEKRAGALADDALSALARTSPPIRREDVAVAFSASIRSIDDIPRDLLTIREKLQAAPVPTFGVDTSVADTQAGGPLAAIVTGTWQAPSFRDGSFVARDADGLPKQNGSFDVPFVLALPKAAASGPVPLLMYQHGNPGSAENEVPSVARDIGAPAGCAVIGFTDIPNRELTGGTDAQAYAVGLFSTTISTKRLPEYISVLGTAEQLAFLRLIPQLASLDVLPLGAPDGNPDLDLAAPLSYLGISQGSIRGVGLMAYAPEIHAAALVAGGGRWSTTIVHQAIGGPTGVDIYGMVTGLYPNVKWGDYWVGASLLQMGADAQDELMHARYLYREPHDLGTDARPSILSTEGLGDNYVPRYATRAAAAAFGIPQVEPVQADVPFLEHASAPLRANLDAATTAGLFQYVAKDYPGVPATPGCVAKDLTEGHFCAQVSDEALAQYRHFFETALDGPPEIIDSLK